MKKAISAAFLVLLAIGLAGLSSCNNGSNKKLQKEKELQQVDSLQKEIEKHVYPLPTSAEVIKMLTDLEVGYILDISNPVENVKKYFTSAARSINLGVYGADLSYATLYNMHQEVIDYMDAIRVIANDLNMSKIYNAPLYDSIKANFDKKDKLVSILTNAFNETYSYMSENDQQALALLVVGGAWVEGMYLTTHVSESAYNVAGISKVLVDQKSSFDLFLDLTKPYMDDAMISDFVNNLEPIKKVYSGMTTSLTEQNIKDITAAITVIRSKIIL
ncbi:MAG: hypothetical protein U0X39_00270 [Bacteroidales bacterium]